MGTPFSNAILGAGSSNLNPARFRRTNCLMRLRAHGASRLVTGGCLAQDARRPGPRSETTLSNRRARGPGARSRPGARAGRGLRHLPQRRPHEGRPLARDRVPAGARPRDRGRRSTRRRRTSPLWKPGDRVGIGWHGGHCGYCDSCRRGDYLTCRNGLQVTGIAFDGGYADYVVAPWEVLARIPDGPHGRRGRSAHVRRRHDLQPPPQLRRAPGRPRRRPRHRRPRASRRPVRREDGLRHRRDRPRRATRSPSRGSSARASTSTARRRTRPRSSRSSAARG